MLKHVMLDKETLGTDPRAVILSIGAVKFDLDGDAIDDQAFYANVSIQSNLDAGRKLNEETLTWWFKQGPEAQGIFHEPKMPLEKALRDFVEWFGDAEFIWSNGASFDIPMMVDAMNGFGIKRPWQFWNERCVRTYKNLPGAKNIRVDNPLKHNALQDAIAQAKLVQAIQRKLSTGHPMIKKDAI